MEQTRPTERVETVIIGGGQAGLATAYCLQREGRPSVILDANERVGDAWRQRWDSLHLFTPARLSHLPGMPQPRSGWSFATKDEFADYLESYADQFDLDVRHGHRAERIERAGDHYLVTAGGHSFEAEHVVLATGGYQEPRVPVFAPELDSSIVQMHASAYRNPGQLRAGATLVVGTGNSGAEIASELAPAHEIYLAGGDPMVFPVRPTSLAARVVMPAFLKVATYVLNRGTPIGRRARKKMVSRAAPLIRVKPKDLAAAGVQRMGRVTGVRDGRPLLEDGSQLDVANVIWCTGYRSDFSWIGLPAFAADLEPEHERGVLSDEPGVYLVGQHFQYALSSTFIGGVGRDAKHIARVIAKRAKARERSPEGERPTLASLR